jgi:hypothetical protein
MQGKHAVFKRGGQSRKTTKPAAERKTSDKPEVADAADARRTFEYQLFDRFGQQRLGNVRRYVRHQL